MPNKDGSLGRNELLEPGELSIAATARNASDSHVGPEEIMLAAIQTSLVWSGGPTLSATHVEVAKELAKILISRQIAGPNAPPHDGDGQRQQSSERTTSRACQSQSLYTLGSSTPSGRRSPSLSEPSTRANSPQRSASPPRPQSSDPPEVSSCSTSQSLTPRLCERQRNELYSGRRTHRKSRERRATRVFLNSDPQVFVDQADTVDDSFETETVRYDGIPETTVQSD